MLKSGIETCVDSGTCDWGDDATYMTVAAALYLICGILLCWYVYKKMMVWMRSQRSKNQ
jgi:hypothetical protein